VGCVTAVDVKKLREQLKLSQEEFSSRFGFNLGTLRHWEQGNRTPDRAASTLLALVAEFPDIVRGIVKDGATKWKNGEISPDVKDTRSATKGASVI